MTATVPLQAAYIAKQLPIQSPSHSKVRQLWCFTFYFFILCIFSLYCSTGRCLIVWKKFFTIVLLLPASMFMGRVSIFHCMGWKLMSDIVCKPSVSWKLLLKVFFFYKDTALHI